MATTTGRDYPLSTTPTLTAISTGPGKGDLVDRIFPSPAQRAVNKEHRIERRTERKETRQGNRDARQTDRAVRRADRSSGPHCNRFGCGGKALGFVGY